VKEEGKSLSENVSDTLEQYQRAFHDCLKPLEPRRKPRRRHARLFPYSLADLGHIRLVTIHVLSFSFYCQLGKSVENSRKW
jgi:hypothetical protein